MVLGLLLRGIRVQRVLSFNHRFSASKKPPRGVPGLKSSSGFAGVDFGLEARESWLGGFWRVV